MHQLTCNESLGRAIRNPKRLTENLAVEPWFGQRAKHG